jgi:hypothetical protein
MDWIELGKTFGFPALIFAVWYIYHVSEVKKWEYREDSDSEKWNLILNQVRDEQQRQFELLRDAVENIGVLTSSVKELVIEFRAFKERSLNR